MQGYYESREGTEGVQRTATGRKIYHCDECGRRKLKKELIRQELYDLPWHDKPRIAYFCKEAPRDTQERAGVESCEELLTQHGWSDFRYFTCCECDRMICEQHPGNGWHTQYRQREDGDQICLRCYEKEILTEGISREKFEEGHLEGMFFSYDNHELKDAGFTEVIAYAHVDSTSRAKELCKQAIELIDSGKLVVIGFESMAIGGLEGNISMWAKDAWLQCPECQTANHYHGGDRLGNHLINEHHFTPAETVDLVKDAERVVMETEPEKEPVTTIISHVTHQPCFTITHVLIIAGPPDYQEETRPFEMKCYTVDKLPPGFSVRPTWGDAFLAYKDDGTPKTACRRHFYNLDGETWTCWPFQTHNSPEQDIVEMLKEAAHA